MNKEELFKNILEKKSFLCVGLDTDTDLLPKKFQHNSQGIFDFNKSIIDATATYCIAYKINVAFYEKLGIEGWESLEMTVKYLKEKKDLFIIMDAKRADIGNTSRQYAAYYFGRLNADAVTVNPYMGMDSLEPFLHFENKWIIILALTSNAGASDFQLLTTNRTHCSVMPDLASENAAIYEQVITKSFELADADQIMFVVGATNDEVHIKKIRSIAPQHFLLVPGIGKQGGNIHRIINNGLNENGGLIINASRSIIFASNDDDFDTVAGEKAREIQQIMEPHIIKLQQSA